MKALLGFGLLLLVSAVLAACGAPAPEAGFSASATEGDVPLEVLFTDQSQGEIDTWEWDFDNDGFVDSVDQSPEYLFAPPGEYTVSLTVRGPGGSDTQTKEACVKVAATPTPTPAPCFAAFSAFPTVGEGYTTVRFTDLSTGGITGWEWDFGDGKSSTEQNPSHEYRRNGLFPVTLTVTGINCDDSVTKRDHIKITGCPT